MVRVNATVMKFVIAIIAIGAVAAIGIPTWQAWELRDEISRGVDVASDNLPEIEKFYASRGRLPRHAGEAGVVIKVNDPSVEYVTWRRSAEDPDRVGYLDVQMTLKQLGPGMTPFVLEARVADNGIQWRCVSARRLGVPVEHSVADFYLPSQCRQGPEEQGL